MANCDVLIVGAGPTGLTPALWLTRLGVRARIVDETAAAGTTSRALAVQARTLELYRQIDLAEAVLARAHKTPAVNLWAKGARKARISFEDAGAYVADVEASGPLVDSEQHIDLEEADFLGMFPLKEHGRVRLVGAVRREAAARKAGLRFEDVGDRALSPPADAGLVGTKL